MDMIYDLINYALPNYLEQYFPYYFILAYTVFNFILFYQKQPNGSYKKFKPDYITFPCKKS